MVAETFRRTAEGVGRLKRAEVQRELDAGILANTDRFVATLLETLRHFLDFQK